MIIKSKMPHFFFDDENSDGIEALNDYFLSWTIRCAVDYEHENKKVQEYSKKILTFLIFGENSNEVVEYISVNTVKQVKSIDLIAEIKLKKSGKLEKYVLLFENKQYTNIHSNQLNRYKSFIDSYYSDKNNNKTDYKRKYIFITGLDQVPESDKEQCEKANFEYYTFMELREKFGDVEETGNYLFDEFWFRYFFYDRGKENLPSVKLPPKFI